MTNEKIIQWARDADPYGKLGKLYEMAELTPDTLRSFAAIVAAATREECAWACQVIIDRGQYSGVQQSASIACRDAIRAMNEKGTTA